MKNPYEVLGVARDADQATIRKAFKTLARKHHPDVSKDPGSEARFKEISAAYDILGDEQKRANWDEFGEVSTQSGFDAEKARAWKNMGARSARAGTNGFSGGGGGGGAGGFNFEDLFGGGDLGSLFGGGARAQRASVHGRGADIEGDVAVDLLDAVRGGSVTVSLQRPAECRTCRGEGGTGRTPCKACSGTGRRTMTQLGMRAVVPCDECAGEGAVYAQECATCAGTGRVREAKSLKIDIPAGVETGQVIRLRGQGAEGRHGGPAGDLLITLAVRDHPILRRSGNDLEMDLPVTLAEAIGGASVEVPTPTGKLRVKVPPGSGNGRRMRIPGKGVQKAGRPGDLYLVVRPQLPPASDPALVELAKKIDEQQPGDVRASLTL